MIIIQCGSSVNTVLSCALCQHRELKGLLGSPDIRVRESFLEEVVSELSVQG